MTVHATRIQASSEVSTLPYVVSTKRRGLYRAFVKRALDIALILVAVPFIAPVLLVLSLLIYMKDGHTPFFLQERVGKDGKRFKMWKFRTMVPDAESKLEAFLSENPEARAEWDSKQKLSVDPRITSIGKTLRKTSADELPQLWNVLKGDMSLVGPRPMLLNQQALYSGLGYYRLRPGMTGSWQVTERSESSFATRASYDDSYDQTLSFVTDVKIIAKTVGVVLRGTGV
jgi:lipopolysaccharide/colanic/teichoic acid biosynthesis glycosyltransferase